MTRTQKKRINRHLIKLQNKFGKKIGKQEWRAWKAENALS